MVKLSTISDLQQLKKKKKSNYQLKKIPPSMKNFLFIGLFIQSFDLITSVSALKTNIRIEKKQRILETANYLVDHASGLLEEEVVQAENELDAANSATVTR